MNQLHLHHEYATTPDEIVVKLNSDIIYQGPATVRVINFTPTVGTNILSVLLLTKSHGNFIYNQQHNFVERDSFVKISDIVVESRYFRNLVTKCGLVEVDLEKHLTFPSKYIDHENVLTMEGSEYSIKFKYPIKNWMQIHKHGRNLDMLVPVNNLIKEKIEK